MLSYWLSWFVFLSGLEDGINLFIFLMAIILVKEERLGLTPIYFGSLYSNLDECMANVVRSIGTYDMVTHTDTIFLQIFFLKWFGALAPKPVCSIEMINTIVEGVKKQKWSAPYKLRAWTWIGVKQANNKSLAKVIDYEKGFNFRPYAYKSRGFFVLHLFVVYNMEIILSP